MATKTVKEGSQPQQQPQPGATNTASGGWGWGSINNFVENTKKSSESFFDNVTATLSKKEQKQNIVINRNIKRTIVHQHQHLPQSQTKPINPPRTELDQWKMKYMELKNASSHKITLLHDELKKYKEHNLNLNHLITQENNPRIQLLEEQIAKYRQNEKKCMFAWQQGISEYFANTDDLQHKMDEKYKIFHEKLMNVAVKCGVNPNDILQNLHSDDARSNISDFEEKENKQKNAKMHLYEVKVVDLEKKLKEFETKFFKEIEKNQILTQKNADSKNTCNELSKNLTKLMSDYDQQRLKYMDLEELFGGMSDQNTEFQQQIKDVRGENELLRQQVSHCNSQLTKNQTEFHDLKKREAKFKRLLDEMRPKLNEFETKLNEESAVSSQLREQIKKISKTSTKRQKSNAKLKKKVEILEKNKKKLEYEQDENHKKIKKYESKIKELEIDERKYANAIAKHKSLQNEIEEYIEDRTELKNKINELNSEIIQIQQHCDDLRKQSKRDCLNISRLTECNEEFVNILNECEDFLSEKASKYLPVSVLDANEFEQSESEEKEQENVTVSNGNGKFETIRVSGKQNIMYFDDSLVSDDSDNENAEDDIFKIEKQKDASSLAMANRIKIQICLITEQLEKFSENIRNFKNALRRKEEESMRQQHALRQVAIRRQLQQQIKNELVKREQNMVSIASVRGVSMRHKTSLKKLTQTQDEIDRVVQKLEEKDENWKENISLQLNGNTKSISMGLDLASTGSPRSDKSMKSTKSLKNDRNGRRRRMGRSKQDIFETQSVRSLSSSNGNGNEMRKKSLNLQRSHSLHRSQSDNMIPMQTQISVLSENGIDNEQKEESDAKKKQSFKSKWFGL